MNKTKTGKGLWLTGVDWRSEGAGHVGPAESAARWVLVSRSVDDVESGPSQGSEGWRSNGCGQERLQEWSRERRAARSQKGVGRAVEVKFRSIEWLLPNTVKFLRDYHSRSPSTRPEWQRPAAQSIGWSPGTLPDFKARSKKLAGVAFDY